MRCMFFNSLCKYWQWQMLKCSKRCTYMEERKKRSHLNLKCTTKECSRPSYATNGKRLVHVHMAIIANLLTALRSCALSSATHATRPRSVGWSLLVTFVPTVTDATSDMPSPSKRGLWVKWNPGQSSLKGKRISELSEWWLIFEDRLFWTAHIVEVFLRFSKREGKSCS